MRLSLISENKKVTANIVKSIASKSGTLFLVFVRKKIRISVKINDKQPDLENERNQVVIDRIARTPNIIRSHKNTLFTNMPKRTGIIKPTKPANTFGLPKNEDALCPQDTYAILL